MLHRKYQEGESDYNETHNVLNEGQIIRIPKSDQLPE